MDDERYHSPIFCDNIILWSIEKDKEDEDPDNDINWRIYIQKKCKLYFDNRFDIKMVSSGKLKDDDIAPAGTTYYRFKISLSEVPIACILNRLKRIVHKKVIFHDIDISQDIGYITTRKDVEKHILTNKICHKKDIVDDRKKVGDNCISFYDINYSKIKIYNKFVQMLESCDVMTILGSRIHNLFVDPSPSFRSTLERTKDVGLTRIEVKFYGEDIHDVQYYIRKFDQIKKTLQGCRFYKSSFENQWMQLTDRVRMGGKQVIMIYLENEKFFAYCHWWNSLTGKMQGGMQSRVNKKDIPLLIANYSFNSKVTTKLIKIKENNNIIVEEYRRTCLNFTLIPGPKGGLYPQIMALQSPRSVAIGTGGSIKIGWPYECITKDSNPLAEIERISITGEIQSIIDLKVSHYRVAYSILQENHKYKVISKGQLIYRGKTCTVIEVIEDEENSNERIKIRCGPALEEFLRGKTMQIWFETGSVVRSRNGSNSRDIKVIAL